MEAPVYKFWPRANSDTDILILFLLFNPSALYKKNSALHYTVFERTHIWSCNFMKQPLKEKFSKKIKILVLSPHLHADGKSFLELHSETALQRSAEQLTQMGTCFKTFKEVTEKKDIQWLHTAQTFFTSFFKMEIFTGAVELKVDAWARLYVEGVNNHLFKSVWDHGASGDFD